jgi:hypothetical protein
VRVRVGPLLGRAGARGGGAGRARAPPDTLIKLNGERKNWIRTMKKDAYDKVVLKF